MEVDSSENSEDSEASLSKSISSSDSLPSETELNKSKLALRSSRRLAIGRKTSTRKLHNPTTSLEIYDAIYLTCEHSQSNHYTTDECSKLFIPGSEDLPKFISKCTFKAINVQSN
ncbi:hypothetical protein O181_130153 [Austropuccinia psidii MF-1]|uniref:Uncharacterized protein n=1 Tax=Austropuccinia psidii MF-1 TaxID=1389203 RepID=A0A9Q3KZI6_9BASI|nr:hypothetical protein [Austropuccinia psidii MF-1]